MYIGVETPGFRVRENWTQILTVIYYLYDDMKKPPLLLLQMRMKMNFVSRGVVVTSEE